MQQPRERRVQGQLFLDESTTAHLELFKTAREQKRHGTLLWHLDGCETPMGSRKLHEFLCAPRVNPVEIDSRLAAVEEFFKSPVADLKNSSDARDAGSSKGGTFLKYFVDKKFPWVHCDIAGTAWHRKDVNYHPKKYGSGAMVRLAIHLLENWKPLNP